MSKSLGNIVEPMGLIEKYGADSVRWYFFTINQPWDQKLFDESDVKDASRRFFMILWNVLQFYKMYGTWRPGRQAASGTPKAKLLINQWVLARLAAVQSEITKKLEAYDIVGAARDLENFTVEDVSRWYIRRIRDIMKENSTGTRLDSAGRAKETAAVSAYLLGEISKLLAPFAPFIAEKIWMELGKKNSVHLEDWARPRGKTPGVKSAKTPGVEECGQILDYMTEVRRIVGLGLEARQKAGIKVRQPLAKLEIKNKKLDFGGNKEFLGLIKEEVNIKNIIFDNSLKDEVRLDTNITPDLREEGVLRDLVREVQAARKTAGLTPKNKVDAAFALPKEIFEAAKKYEKEIMKETNLKSVNISESPEVKILLKK